MTHIALEGAQIGATITLLAIMWSKTSFAVTLLRITEGKTKMFVWAIIVMINVGMGIQCFLVWGRCKPMSFGWDKTAGGKCWDGYVFNTIAMSMGSFSGVCDIVLALLPWRILWHLRMKKKEKVGVSLAMSMGVL